MVPLLQHRSAAARQPATKRAVCAARCAPRRRGAQRAAGGGQGGQQPGAAAADGQFCGPLGVHGACTATPPRCICCLAPPCKATPLVYGSLDSRASPHSSTACPCRLQATLPWEAAPQGGFQTPAGEASAPVCLMPLHITLPAVEPFRMLRTCQATLPLPLCRVPQHLPLLRAEEVGRRGGHRRRCHRPRAPLGERAGAGLADQQPVHHR